MVSTKELNGDAFSWDWMANHQASLSLLIIWTKHQRGKIVPESLTVVPIQRLVLEFECLCSEDEELENDELHQKDVPEESQAIPQ